MCLYCVNSPNEYYLCISKYYKVSLFSFFCTPTPGVPVRPANLQKITQAAKSSVYKLPYEMAFTERSIEAWKRELSSDQVQEIEEICGPLMSQLGYTRTTKAEKEG